MGGRDRRVERNEGGRKLGEWKGKDGGGCRSVVRKIKDREGKER